MRSSRHDSTDDLTTLDINDDFFFASDAGVAVLNGDIPATLAPTPRTLHVVCTTIGNVTQPELTALMSKVYPAARRVADQFNVTLTVALPWGVKGLSELEEGEREARTAAVTALATSAAPSMYLVLSGDGYGKPTLAPVLSPEVLEELVEQFTPKQDGGCCVIS